MCITHSTRILALFAKYKGLLKMFCLKALYTFGIPSKLGRYRDIIEYRGINLETISISDGFGFNRNINIYISQIF